MTDTNAPGATPEDRPTYSRASRMRIALAAAAAELADSAAAFVPTDCDHAAYPGELVADANRLAAAASYLRTLAVACERLAGTTWPTIGSALGDITRQAAHDRYAAPVARYERALVLSWLLGDDAPAGLPEGANRPAETAAYLDRWLDRRGTDPLLGERRTASGALAPASIAEETTLMISTFDLLLDPESSPADKRRLRIAHHRRAVSLWQRVAEDETLSEADRLSARESAADHAGHLAALEREAPIT